ncbi:Ketol-acid reductoisomerase (NADP(+)) [Buchnera aphidicola (Eriosoma grossulariae)]|uniref:ketol-acid reductoisomerase n=1 Tax=Buchnera aphidicola TaxID=9 RepID=UPI003464D0E0
MKNYFNSLNFREKLIELKKCRLMKKKEFLNYCSFLKEKKIVIIGCGSQGLNQGLNMRDSGLDISFALRKESIQAKTMSWKNAFKNNFVVDIYENLIPTADLVINLTPDKQHHSVIQKIQPLMKNGSCLGYSHGFNIVEMGEKIRKDITVIMVAPKCPGSEVREEYKRNFGVPTLIAVHNKNNPQKIGLEIAKAWAVAIGSHHAGILESSFIAEVKSDLMGEQTILCGMLQAGSLICYEYLVEQGHNIAFACKLIQNGWEVLTESLKHGGITLMLDRISNNAKIRVCYLSNQLKIILTPLFQQHMDNILSGSFSSKMMDDWNNNDIDLLKWRLDTKKTSFENAPSYNGTILEQEYFDFSNFMIAIIKAGVELSFETMINAGIIEESAYYESLHELPLIANTISRKRLYEMNLIISDTAEYGSYLFSNSAIPILKNFLKNLQYGDMGHKIISHDINNIDLYKINQEIENHPIEIIGKKLRKKMKNMKTIFVK